jgi:ankyrin repeat protein
MLEDILVDAVLSGDLPMVETLLTGMNPNKQVNAMGTLLHVAVTSKNLDAVELILKKGADINAKNKVKGETALHIAAKLNDTDIAKFLIIHGADIHSVDTLTNTPLHKAAKSGQAAMVKLLVDAGADVHAVNQGNDTALHLTVQADNGMQAAQILLAHGADVDAKGSGSMKTPLHFAAFYGKDKMVRMLLNHGANPNIVNGFGETPLSDAAHSRDESTLFALLNTPAIDDINRAGSWGRTPLHNVIIGPVDLYSKSPAAISLLLSKGADPTIIDEFGDSCTDLAKHFNPGLVPLLKAGAENSNWADKMAERKSELKGFRIE